MYVVVSLFVQPGASSKLFRQEICDSDSHNSHAVKVCL